MTSARQSRTNRHRARRALQSLMTVPSGRHEMCADRRRDPPGGHGEGLRTLMDDAWSPPGGVWESGGDAPLFPSGLRSCVGLARSQGREARLRDGFAGNCDRVTRHFDRGTRRGNHFACPRGRSARRRGRLVRRRGCLARLRGRCAREGGRLSRSLNRFTRCRIGLACHCSRFARSRGRFARQRGRFNRSGDCIARSLNREAHFRDLYSRDRDRSACPCRNRVGSSRGETSVPRS
jgi:hypothetical protein